MNIGTYLVLVLFEFLLPVHTMQQVPITYFHVEFCDSSSSFHRCLWIVCITQQMAFLPWLLLILCLPHSVGWPFKYLFFQELQKMFWQRQLNPFHVVEFQTGAILMLIQVGWRKNSSTTVHSTSRATIQTIFRVVSHLLVPSSCRLQLALFASLAHDAMTMRDQEDHHLTWGGG